MVNQVELSADVAELKADLAAVTEKAIAAGVAIGDCIVALFAHGAELTAAHGVPVAATPHIAAAALAAGVTNPTNPTAPDSGQPLPDAPNDAAAAGTDTQAGTTAPAAAAPAEGGANG